jgi:hypothetical protein
MPHAKASAGSGFRLPSPRRRIGATRFLHLRIGHGDKDVRRNTGDHEPTPPAEATVRMPKEQPVRRNKATA